MATRPDAALALPAALALLPALSGCNDPASMPVAVEAARITDSTSAALSFGAVPSTRYDLANGCYALRSVSRSAYVARTLGGYAARAATLGGAEPFFLKPTALGKYLFYDKDASFLAAGSLLTLGGLLGVAAVPAPTAASDWTVDTDATGHFRVLSASTARALAVNPVNGHLVLVNAASAGDSARFTFEPATGCAAFPEIATNSAGAPFRGNGIAEPVLGFADVHAHVSATSFLGGAHHGLPFHRFGVLGALGDCTLSHGPGGIKDVVGNSLGGSPVSYHDNRGWPHFVDWPASRSLTHEGMYYRWIERAWRAGLRLMVNNLVENETLCSVQRIASLRPLQSCNEMDSALAQAQFMRDLEAYIDAQEGGPGRGWFRLVESPAEARQVIDDGKLAVVLGIEISHLFNCDVQHGVAGCDEASIDEQLDRLYAAGVRQMFPVHEFDNALGGNGIFDSFTLNLGNKIDTGHFWETYDCPEQDYFYDAGAVLLSLIPPGAGHDPLTAVLIAQSGGALPLYPPDRKQCNERGLTALGRYAIQRMMEKRIIIEVDHLELSNKAEVIALAEQQTPGYPLVSTHGGHGGLTVDQARRIMALGGLIYPYKGTGKEFKDALDKLSAIRGDAYFFGMGYGADTNGLGPQAGPRGAGATPVSYPFTLFQGPDWGPQFAGLAPVSFDRQVSGERVYDTDVDGMAHYGLVADWVEEVRLEGGEAALTALYNSAEAYLQMWERTLDR
ncbi:peptidase M19 [Sorangium sp. So ce233]|uniref:peptidase M19 n=1 Tax=Sorangium sp. So ce233 TaxID=3133290 RepID=UPI003F6452E8